MKLIVGLGNPGIVYANSRHNIGFLVVKSLSKEKKINLRRDKGAIALSAKFKYLDEEILIAIPLTFMNLSGLAVSSLIKKYKVALKDILIICDDLDLEFGRLKLKPKGSSGGHRGLTSIINSISSQNFARLRIGIGRPHSKIVVSEYVLSSFGHRHKEPLKKVINEACACVDSWIKEGIDRAMNAFNKTNLITGEKRNE
jgi:PTH1 family peptidyl-tRNA hydrolase